MDGCCITDDSTSLESQSVALAPPTPPSLCRMGSGTVSSVVQEAEGGAEAESKKLPSSRFKGVVPQPNGRWGAQIYEKHQRVWLGTFNGEEEAARSYDIAAQRFRGPDAVTNFKPLVEEGEARHEVEIAFLSSRSKAEIVDMLRKHTYHDELEQSRKNYGFLENSTIKPIFGLNRVNKTREPLFEKSVTPSDVGKLNRLVIPKQHAEKHFPLGNGTCSKGMLLNFEDMDGKVWRFRYSYWNSSQSYVLTKGWSRYVKENNMQAGNIVSFHKSTGLEKKFYIECKQRNGSSTTTKCTLNHVPQEPSLVNQVTVVDYPGQPGEMLRLFGVNIMKASPVVMGGSLSGKRNREMEILGLEGEKKQRAIIDAM